MNKVSVVLLGPGHGDVTVPRWQKIIILFIYHSLYPSPEGESQGSNDSFGSQKLSFQERPRSPQKTGRGDPDQWWGRRRVRTCKSVSVGGPELPGRFAHPLVLPHVTLDPQGPAAHGKPSLGAAWGHGPWDSLTLYAGVYYAQVKMKWRP